MGISTKGIRYIDPDQPMRRVAEYMEYLAEDVDRLLSDRTLSYDFWQDVTAYVYGHSYSDPAVMVPGQTDLPGMWYNQLAAMLGGEPPVSYGRGGQRVDFGIGAMLAAGAWPGHAAPPAGAVWPGVSARKGEVFVNYLMNDAIHSNGVSAAPQPIAGASGDRYVAGIQAMYEAMFAVASSETRLEIAAGRTGVTFNGAGWGTFGAGYLSSGDFAWTNGANDYVTYGGVVPPQAGPFAGKVYVGRVGFDPAVLPNADAAVRVDAGADIAMGEASWEAYGAGGAANQSYGVMPVSMPADTAAHTLRITRANTSVAGEYLTLDAVFIPSETPPTIYVLDDPDPIPGAYTAAEVAIIKANMALIRPAIKAAIAKFPNVVWVPCNITPGVLWVDGIHPETAGMTQRADDARSAVLAVHQLGLPAAKRLLAA